MIKKAISAFVAIMLGFSTATAGTLPVFAENAYTSDACNSSISAEQKAALGCDDGGKTAPLVVTNVLKAIIGVLGIVAVFVIVFAGQRYVVSQGDPGRIAQARAMLIYAVIGLLVAILSFAIISFIQNAVF